MSIVEGDGEVEALPVLLRRMAQWLSPGEYINVGRPIRVRRDQFLNKAEVFEKQLRLAAGLCLDEGWILILLDADDDCPMELSRIILQRAAAIVPNHFVSVVLANREYEAWFIASAETLTGCRDFVCPPDIPDAESVRAAKQWISAQVQNGSYREVIGQPAFSAGIDLERAHANSRSFRKLCSDWQRAINHLTLAGV
ncbi:DUF4276 family protein [Pseudoduganella sp. R-34]|uniref:DUF4276 family protein n=1 Tax=Pseudoduganella sp. R-34 TaxID=3404062 RepID=UPI003CEA214E